MTTFYFTFFQLTTDLKDTVPDSKEKEEVFGESEQLPSEAPELVSTAINVSFYKHSVEKRKNYSHQKMFREINILLNSLKIVRVFHVIHTVMQFRIGILCSDLL